LFHFKEKEKKEKGRRREEGEEGRRKSEHI
jgi:hypothetical protein